MFGSKLKRQQFRRQIRKGQMEVYFKNERNKLIVQHQEEAYRETGQIGFELLKDLTERNQDRDDIKKLQEHYPIDKLQQFLDSTYDRSDSQYFAIRAMESYFYVGYSERPSQLFIDKILRVLTQVDKVDTMKLILLILCDILHDHYKYSHFLITKKAIVPKVLSIFQAYVNNSQIKRIVYRLIQLLVQNADWHEDIGLLVQPLLYMMNQSHDNEVTAIIQTLYNTIQIKPSLFASILYEKAIHKTCLSIMRTNQSRVATFLYLKLLPIIDHKLKEDDIKEVFQTITFIRQRKYKVGDGMAKYSSYQIQLSVYRIINNFLRSEDHSFSTNAMSYIQGGMIQQLKEELQKANDQNILFAVAQILFAVCLQSEGKHDYADLAMEKCEYNRKANELQKQYEYIRLHHPPSSRQMDIEYV